MEQQTRVTSTRDLRPHILLGSCMDWRENGPVDRLIETELKRDSRIHVTRNGGSLLLTLPKTSEQLEKDFNIERYIGRIHPDCGALTAIFKAVNGENPYKIPEKILASYKPLRGLSIEEFYNRIVEMQEAAARKAFPNARVEVSIIKPVEKIPGDHRLIVTDNLNSSNTDVAKRAGMPVENTYIIRVRDIRDVWELGLAVNAIHTKCIKFMPDNANSEESFMRVAKEAEAMFKSQGVRVEYPKARLKL